MFRDPAATEVLRLYGTLHPAQQAKMLGAGLSVGDLNSSQQVVFVPCLDRVFHIEPSPFQVGTATIRLAVESQVVERRQGQKRVEKEAVFTCTAAGGKEKKVEFLLASVAATTVTGNADQ
jgi:hypothetical protein